MCSVHKSKVVLDKPNQTKLNVKRFFLFFFSWKHISTNVLLVGKKNYEQKALWRVKFGSIKLYSTLMISTEIFICINPSSSVRKNFIMFKMFFFSIWTFFQNVFFLNWKLDSSCHIWRILKQISWKSWILSAIKPNYFYQKNNIQN